MHAVIMIDWNVHVHHEYCHSQLFDIIHAVIMIDCNVHVHHKYCHNDLFDIIHAVIMIDHYYSMYDVEQVVMTVFVMYMNITVYHYYIM
jgi:hypothetical protein